MKKPDLVFVTRENEHKMKKLVESGEDKFPRCERCSHIITGPHDCPST